MYALMTMIAILRQNAKMEHAFVKETPLETGKTAEVRLITNMDLIEGHIYESHMPERDMYTVLCVYHFR